MQPNTAVVPPQLVMVVPLIPSHVSGLLGVMHLPRLWAKLSLAAAGVLLTGPEGWDECGDGYDAAVLKAFNVTRETVIAHVRDDNPTLVQFERWMKKQAGLKRLTKAKVKKLNRVILGYRHKPEVRAGIIAETGLPSNTWTTAPQLNFFQDAAALHRQLFSSPVVVAVAAIENPKTELPLETPSGPPIRSALQVALDRVVRATLIEMEGEATPATPAPVVAEAPSEASRREEREVLGATD